MFCFLIFYVLSCYFFFLKFYITFTISFRRKKNRSNVMTNFIFCLSTSGHRLNQVDLQELLHCDGTRPMKNSPHYHSRRFSFHTELIHIFHDSSSIIEPKKGNPSEISYRITIIEGSNYTNAEK